jgi:hypothetical protein
MKKMGFMRGVIGAAIVLGLIAAGGFPSRPRLQALGINTTVPATGNLAVATGITVGGQNVCLANGTNCPTATAVSASDGAANTPSYTFSLDTDLGLYRRTTNTLAVTTGNRPTLDISSGVLAVISDGGFDAGDATIRFRNSDFSGEKGLIGFPQAATDVMDVGTVQNTDLRFLTNNSARMTLGGATGVLALGSHPTVGGRALMPTITCTAACDASSILVGQRAIVVKQNNTNRASTATSAADAELQFTSVPLGTYHLEGYVVWTSGAGGFRAQWSANGNAIDTVNAQLCDTTGTVTAMDSLNDATCASTTGGRLSFTGGGNVTSGAGTLSFDWAQNSSNVANTTLLGSRSRLVLTRVQ